MAITDSIGVLACIGLSIWLLSPALLGSGEFLPLAITTVLVTLLVARHMNFYHSIVRYIGIGLAVASIKVAVASAGTLAITAYFSNLGNVPVRLAIVYGAFFGLYLVGSRYMAQHLLVRRATGKERVIVYGAGEAGAQVVRTMQNGETYAPDNAKRRDVCTDRIN
jgi:FlaA1/EpsC-like NDP-sugar epimerase